MAGPFAAAMFLAATLLFLIQPLIAKSILPKFGGSPAVWNACMAFFQAVLLLGYLYAHLSVKWLGIRRQAAVHLVLLAAPLAALPFAISRDWSPAADTSPILTLLGLLAMTAGGPYFVVSSTAPLLQRWFAASGGSQTGDPYYLYTASNAGSLLGLLAYPAVIEPLWPLGAQSQLWTYGYLALFAAIGVCAWLVRRRPEAATSPPSPRGRAAANELSRSATASLRGRWVLWAFAPSSLLLGVTSYVTADIAPAPMLWIVPLALYLFSFILAFSRWPRRAHRAVCGLLPLAALWLCYVMQSGATFELGGLALHLATFFFAALACHGELAIHRPEVGELTEYYLWISVGGVAGGMFNVLLAPCLFTTLLEYPLAISLACASLPNWSRANVGQSRHFLNLALPVVAGLFTAALYRWGSESAPWRVGLPLLGCASLIARPKLFAVCLAVVVLSSSYCRDRTSGIVYRERNFYGSLWIAEGRSGRSYTLGHGAIYHGAQNRSDDPRVRSLPLLYYFRSGPIGQVFGDFQRRGLKPRTAVVGLGVGALASYGVEGQQFTFYELNPAVEKLAADGDYFTYLRESRATVRVVPGDARLSLEREAHGAYDLIVVDAFSGDAIPVHLLTQQAVRLYCDKLARQGVLAFHITNRFVDLTPVLANVARAERLVVMHDDELSRTASAAEARMGKSPSHWLLMARSHQDFGRLPESPDWQPLTGDPTAHVWTDDYSDLLSAVRWR